MSEKNHPNFHAVKFATDITHSLFECLRGKARIKHADWISKETIQKFVLEVEERIDNAIKKEEFDKHTKVSYGGQFISKVENAIKETKKSKRKTLKYVLDQSEIESEESKNEFAKIIRNLGVKVIRLYANNDFKDGIEGYLISW